MACGLNSLNCYLKPLLANKGDTHDDWPIDLNDSYLPNDSALNETLASICAAIQGADSEAVYLDDPISSPRPQLPFVDLWWPAVDCALVRLHHRVNATPGAAPIARQLDSDLAHVLLERLCTLGEQPLWELFKALRGVGVSVCAYFDFREGVTEPSSREQYRRFIERHRADGLATLLGEFPVLGRLLAQAVVFWLDSSAEALMRVQRDRNDLQAALAIPVTAQLASIRQGISDRHRQGRTVAILTFSEGPDTWDVVYKPRDLTIDFEFQRLLEEQEVICLLPPLASLKVLKRAGYGYMELARHQPCVDEKELALFYSHAGRLAAILYLLGCTDGHHENLIASGANLLLIDTETLFEPIIRDAFRAASSADAMMSRTPLQKRFEASVARTELFPAWLLVGLQQQAIDTSAFGVPTSSYIQRTVPGWQNLNCDDMAPGTYTAQEMQPSSLPVGRSQSNPFEQHLTHLRRGFCMQACAFMQMRDSWLEPGGILERFSGLTGRVVLRATRIYFGIQQQQLRADALRSLPEQQRRLDQLSRLHGTAASPECNWPVFAAERCQMAQLDIPYFAHRVDQNDLLPVGSAPPINDYFETSGLEACRRRLEDLSEDVIAFQLQVIDGMSAAKALRAHQIKAGNLPPGAPGITPVPSHTRLRMAQAIADDLTDTIVEQHPEWLGFDLTSDGRRFHFRPLGLSPYSGALGIAAFLACLSRSNEMPWSRPEAGLMIQRIIEPLYTLADQQQGRTLLRWWRDQPLGLAGCGGQLLALLAIEDTGLMPPCAGAGRALAIKLVEGFDEVCLTDSPPDLILGAAGLLGSLLILNTERSVAIAITIGDQLTTYVPGAIKGSGTTENANLYCPGFTKGAAGVVAALTRLYLRTGFTRYREHVWALLNHDREVLGIGNDGWESRLAHSMAQEPSQCNSWCRGSAGMALGRLGLFGTEFWDATTAREIDALLGSLRTSTGLADHVCCGSFGVVAVLRIACDILGNAKWRTRADEIEALATRIVTPEKHHLGLMNGISGIGLVLIDNPLSRSMMKRLLGVGLLDCVRPY